MGSGDASTLKESLSGTAVAASPGLVERFRRAPRLYLLGPLALLVPYLAIMRVSSGTFRPEQLGITALALFLGYWSDGSRTLLKGLFAFLVFGVVYDLTHLTEPLVRYLHVHIAEPYHFDQTWFGIQTAAGRLTPNEFFALHHWPAVDLVTGTAYIIFIYWAIALAVYLSLFRKEPEMKTALWHYGWVFFGVNLAGFITYYVYPSAPPWYVTNYGFGPPDFAHIVASPAACVRWDQLTGISYFAAFYGRSADVFGAIPSLHVAYPMLVFVYGRRVGNSALNVVNFAFYLLVCFSAVYLQHHYVLDVLLGTAYALTGCGVERGITRYLESRRRVGTA